MNEAAEATTLRLSQKKSFKLASPPRQAPFVFFFLNSDLPMF